MSQRWIALQRRRRAEGGAPDRVLNIAHRGARAVAPENTLAAIEAAAASGADMVEIDVHRSRDGALVVTHDLAGAPGLADIRARDPRVPLLADALSCARGLSLLVNVEIKNLPARYPGIERDVVDTIDRLAMSADVIVSSFDHELLAALRRLDDRVATAVLTSDRLFRPVEYLAALDADALHPGNYDPDPETIRTIRASGRGVNVWTVNEDARMRRLAAAGVTGIITDYPDRLAYLLGQTTP